MRRAFLASTAALALGLSPALADGPQNGGSPRINGAFGSQFTLAPIASSGVRTVDWLNALETVVSGATQDLQTGVSDGPNGPISRALRNPFTEPGNALVTFVQSRYSLTNTQIASIFTAAGAVVSQNGAYVTATAPTPAQIGAAASGANYDITSLNSLLTISAASPVSGAITTDGYNLLGQGGSYTANQIYEWAIGPGGSPAPAYDGARGVANCTAGSTILTCSGAAGYVLNDAVIGASLPAAVALFGVGVSDADHASTWGVDTILSDSRGQTVSTGVGRYLSNEMDFNVTSPSTTVNGLYLAGSSVSQPTSATGVTVGKLGSTGNNARWNYAFGTSDGNTNQFALIGTQGTGANAFSQTLHFNTIDSGGTERYAELQLQQDFLVLNANQGAGHGNLSLPYGSYYAATNGGLLVNFHTLASADSGSNAYLASDAAFSTVHIGNGSATVALAGKILTNLRTPASSSDACMQGEIADDANYHYVCVASAVWKRVALSTF